MSAYLPFFLIVGLACALLFGFGSSILKKKRDYDVEWLKRSRRISMPDNPFYLQVHELQLCVACESVHLTDRCPRCASDVSIPLVRVVRSTRGFEFPIWKDELPANVIELPLPSRSIT